MSGHDDHHDDEEEEKTATTDQTDKHDYDHSHDDEEEPSEEVAVVEEKKKALGPEDYDILREQVRNARGMKLTPKPKKRIPLTALTVPSKIPVRKNSAYNQRVKATKQYLRKPDLPGLLKILKAKAEKGKENEIENYKTNVSSDYREKHSKGNIIVSEHMKDNFKKFGKPPYKPYVRPDSDMSKDAYY